MSDKFFFIKKKSILFPNKKRYVMDTPKKCRSTIALLPIYFYASCLPIIHK